MPNPEDIYLKCDDLDNVPPLMRDNYLHENKLLSQELPLKARILQVGSLDGRRIISLLKLRPDLQFTGLEIEKSFISLAEKNVQKSSLNANFIHGDITQPPSIPKFDYVICLNNTLGYIPAEQAALNGMKRLGKNIIVSVYGGKFTDALAIQYFSTLGLTIDHIIGNSFTMNDFTTIKRFTRKQLEDWGFGITETPVGYFGSISR